MADRRQYNQILIRNLGTFWRSDQVFWGSPGKSAQLLGVRPNAKKATPTDFWLQTGVYALYAGYDLIYVGQTHAKGLGPRLKDHRKDHLAGRWDRFSWFGVRHVKQDSSLFAPPELRVITLDNILDHLEGVLIAVAEPPLNGQEGRFGERVVRFEQFPSASPSDASLTTLQNRVEGIQEQLKSAARPRTGPR